MLGPGNDVVCSRGCVDEVGTWASDGMTTVHASAGAPVDVPPMHARIASNATNSCARCDCAMPERPATGVVFRSTPF